MSSSHSSTRSRRRPSALNEPQGVAQPGYVTYLVQPTESPGGYSQTQGTYVRQVDPSVVLSTLDAFMPPGASYSRPPVVTPPNLGRRTAISRSHSDRASPSAPMYVTQGQPPISYAVARSGSSPQPSSSSVDLYGASQYPSDMPQNERRANRLAEANYSTAARSIKNDIGHLITSIEEHPFSVQGHFCDVLRGDHVTAGKVALKRLRAGENEGALVPIAVGEWLMWMGLKHKRILKCLGMFMRRDFLYFVSPYIKNGNLSHWTREGRPGDRPKMIRELADALVYMHSCGIVHGDIKASNVLVSDDFHILLCDFGLSKQSGTDTMSRLKGFGTVRWQSPELISGASKTFQSDVYAFGITIAEILSGRTPYPHIKADITVMMEVCSRNERPSREPEAAPDGTSYRRVWRVAERCWPTNPAERISMNQAYAELSG